MGLLTGFRVLAVLLLVSIGFLGGSMVFPPRTFATSPVLTENFANNTFNSSLWKLFQQGNGPTVAVVNQRLEVTIPSTSTNDPTIGGFGAGIGSLCLLHGDFDLQVGFQLLTWPPNNGVRVGTGPSVDGLSSQVPPFAVERDSLSAFDSVTGEFYLTHMLDGVNGLTPTTALSGLLRITRSGATSTGYYINGSSWVQIHSGPVITSDVGFGFAAWSHDSLFSHQTENVALDNFTLNSGQLQCPQISLTPNKGLVGTLVTVKGSGFPILQSYYPTTQSVSVSFDDMFLGTTQENNGTFTFSFDVPQAQQGFHLVKVVDSSTNTNTSAQFQVISQPGPPTVQLVVGSVYFPGDTAVAEVLVTSNGNPIATSSLQLNITLTRPDGSHIVLNVTTIGNGLFKASYQIPKTATLGTYALIATAQTLGGAAGSTLGAFEVKLPWLSSQASTLTAAGLASVAALAVGLVSWRKGYFSKPPKDSF